MFDIGNPIGFRIAMKRPQQIQSIIIQNGSPYAEGADPNTANPFFDYLQIPNPETEKVARTFLYQ